MHLDEEGFYRPTLQSPQASGGLTSAFLLSSF